MGAVRIAFYCSLASTAEPQASGDRTQALALITALRDQGHEVEIISEYKAKLFWRRPARWRLPAAVWAAWRRTRGFRPDAWLTFVSQWDAPDVMGPLLTARRGIRYVIYKSPYRGRTYSDLRRREGSLLQTWAALPGWALHRVALRRADSLVVNKAADFMGYQQDPVASPKLGLLWPAVPLGQFRPDEAQRARVRQGVGVPADTAVLLSVGRLWDKMGRKAASLKFLIDATEELIGRGRRVRLVIVGDGEDKPEIEEHAAKLGPAVTFTGPVDYADLPGWYNAADVFAYPGLRESIGLVHLEAQACGLPVVAFANGGMPSIVKDGETGFLVPPMDQPAFVQRLDQLVRDGELRRRLGGGGRAHVEEHHNLETWGKTLAGILQ
jgi:glycosyltransferase involved in cell wall biosynthesis